MKQPVYLDYAAATPVDPRVIVAMQPFFSDKFYNPSATYTSARLVQQDLLNARSKVALLIGSKSSNVIFTAGGTEANNLAIKGVLEQNPGSNVLVSAIEHESVLEPAKKYPHKIVPVQKDGIIDVPELIKLINDQTVLISVMYVNNEIGSVEPLRKISAEIRKIRDARLSKKNRLPLYFHTDAAQAANYLDLHVASLGVDLMTLNGGKIYGPKQSGILYVGSGVKLLPQILGGGQERGIRSGTENVAGAEGFSIALELAQTSRHDEAVRLANLQKLFFSELNQKIPTAIVNGSIKNRVVNNIHITLPGYDNERILIKLDEAGICAAAGSACSASNEEPSHVLKAIGLNDSEAQSSIRFTMGKSTDKSSVEKTVRILRSLL